MLADAGITAIQLFVGGIDSVRSHQSRTRNRAGHVRRLRPSTLAQTTWEDVAINIATTTHLATFEQTQNLAMHFDLPSQVKRRYVRWGLFNLGTQLGWQCCAFAGPPAELSDWELWDSMFVPPGLAVSVLDSVAHSISGNSVQGMNLCQFECDGPNYKGSVESTSTVWSGTAQCD